jgi:hypothetical protein
MKKMIKMSLVAAVAVAGLTTTASAQNLEDAIKGVDVSGMMRYRYDETSQDGKDKSATNNYRLDVKVKSKINDMMTANVTVGVSENTGNGVSLGNDDTDGAAGLSVRDANFAANLGFATVIAGKQQIPGPFVDNAGDDVSRGTGAVALIPVGPITLAAGYFNNHNVVAPSDTDTQLKALNVTLGSPMSDLALSTAITNYLKDQSAMEIAVLGAMGPVSFDAWYANVSDTLDAVSVGVKAKIEMITIDARYSELDMEDAYTNVVGAGAYDSKSTLGKIVASAAFGPVSVVAGYGVSGEDNGKLLNRIAIDRDNDSAVDFKVWQASLGQLSDADAYLIGAGFKATDAISIDAKYLVVNFGAADTDATETLVGATYKMSKNFSTHARYSVYAVDGSEDSNKGRLELKYTF